MSPKEFVTEDGTLFYNTKAAALALALMAQEVGEDDPRFAGFVTAAVSFKEMTDAYWAKQSLLN